MLIADTGPLVAMLNAKDKHHEACTALFRRFRGPIVVPAPIVTEVAYFLQIEPGPAVEAAFLDALARSELTLRPPPRKTSPGWLTSCGGTRTSRWAPRTPR